MRNKDQESGTPTTFYRRNIGVLSADKGTRAVLADDVVPEFGTTDPGRKRSVNRYESLDGNPLQDISLPFPLWSGSETDLYQVVWNDINAIYVGCLAVK